MAYEAPRMEELTELRPMLKLHRVAPEGPDLNALVLQVKSADGITALRELLVHAEDAALLYSFDTDAVERYEIVYPDLTRPGAYRSFSSRLSSLDDVVRFTAETVLFVVHSVRRAAFNQHPVPTPYRTEVSTLVGDARAALISFEAELEGAQVDGRWEAFRSNEEASRSAHRWLLAARAQDALATAKAEDASPWQKLKNWFTNSY
jgi:hypothetical protein